MKLKLLDGATATNSAPVIATGTITTVAKASLADTDYMTILTNRWPGGKLFEFDTAGDGVTSGRIQVDVSGDTSANDVRDTLIAAINASVIGEEILATSGGASTVNLRAKTIGSSANRTITENVADAGFAVTGMASGAGGAYLWRQSIGGSGLERGTDRALLNLVSTAGSGTMTVTVRLWGFNTVVNDWMPLGVGTDSTKGTIDASTSADETQADRIQHTEVIEGLASFEAIYAEITAIGGTATAVDLWLTSMGEGAGPG